MSIGMLISVPSGPTGSSMISTSLSLRANASSVCAGVNFPRYG